MRLSGEALPFVEAITFNSKRQLLNGLKAIKKNAAGLTEPDKTIVVEMTSASIEEIAHYPETELLELKEFLKKRGGKNN